MLFARSIFSDIFAGSKILAGNSPAGPPSKWVVEYPILDLCREDGHFLVLGRKGQFFISRQPGVPTKQKLIWKMASVAINIDRPPPPHVGGRAVGSIGDSSDDWRG